MKENLPLISPKFESTSYKYTPLRFSEDDNELICIFSVYENKEINKNDEGWEKALEYVATMQPNSKLNAQE
jgi:hypothetical protein